MSARVTVGEFCDVDQAQEFFSAVCNVVPAKVVKTMTSFTIVFEDKTGEPLASVKAYKERQGWDLEALGPCVVSSFGGLRP